MSLHNAANHLAAQGRGPDDKLIHMSGKEIAGLQALAMAHGGSLTINPKTGLPEAGFLDNLLPTIVGAGIGYFTGNPMMAAAIMGGGTYLNTGDLGKGLMAGIGGYGAGSLGSGFAGMGESALAAGPGSVDAVNGMDLASDRAAGITAPSMSDKFSAAASSFGKPGTVEALGGWKNIGMAAAPALMDMMGGKKTLSTAPGTEQMIRPYSFAANPQQLEQQEKMIGSTYEPGQDTSERTWFRPEYTALPAYKAAEGGLMGLASGGLTSKDANPMRTAMNWINPETMPGMSPEMFKTVDSWKDKYFPLEGAGAATTPQASNLRFDPETQTYVDATTGAAVTQMAGGGLAGIADIVVGDSVMPMGEEEEKEKNMAQGGLSSLGGYAAGGNPRLLKGPGDGMSDNIPAVIGNKQPARLADGEFVVPADVVSHLGNGSTDAGAKQLYKMMDRIRAQRTGKKKQAPQVNPTKAMPA